MGSLIGVGLAVAVAALGGLAVLKNIGDRIVAAELPAPLGESIASSELEEGETYHVYISAKNAPDKSSFHIKGSIQTGGRDGRAIESFSLTSHDYEDWAWETDKGSDEWNTEKIGEFTAPHAGTYNIVLDELEIGADVYEMHEIYIWKPKVNL